MHKPTFYIHIFTKKIDTFSFPHTNQYKNSSFFQNHELRSMADSNSSTPNIGGNFRLAYTLSIQASARIVYFSPPKNRPEIIDALYY